MLALALVGLTEAEAVEVVKRAWDGAAVSRPGKQGRLPQSRSRTGAALSRCTRSAQPLACRRRAGGRTGGTRPILVVGSVLVRAELLKLVMGSWTRTRPRSPSRAAVASASRGVVRQNQQRGKQGLAKQKKKKMWTLFGNTELRFKESLGLPYQ